MDFVRIRASESCRTAYDWEVYSMNNNIVSKSIFLLFKTFLMTKLFRKIAVNDSYQI